MKETCLEKYGVENYSQTDEYKEKYKETCLEKYGCEFVLQSEEIKKKSKQTCLEKYGKESYTQTEEYKNKYKDANFIEHLKETNKDKFGTDWYFQSNEYKNKFNNYEWVKRKNKKCYNTKKKNNSFNTSKIEDQLKQYLEKITSIIYINTHQNNIHLTAISIFLINAYT